MFCTSGIGAYSARRRFGNYGSVIQEREGIKLTRLWMEALWLS